MKNILPIAIAFLLFSCKKEDLARPITAGDINLVQEVGYNFLLHGNLLGAETAQIDLDQDGTNDVELYSSAASSGSSGLMPVITIKTLHTQVAIHVDVRQDSVFQANTYHWQYAPDGTPAYFYSKLTSCERETAQFAPIGVETNKYLEPMAEGHLLSPNSAFAQGTFGIATAEQQSTEVEFFPDSTVYHIERLKSSCFTFPENSIRYLGFKIGGDYGQKLGWIEVEYLGDSMLRIRDWAIQRD